MTYDHTGFIEALKKIDAFGIEINERNISFLMQYEITVGYASEEKFFIKNIFSTVYPEKFGFLLSSIEIVHETALQNKIICKF